MATIPVGQFPHGLRVSPNGKEVYVANLKGGTVSVIDTASQKEVAQVPTGKGPAQTGFTPDGRLAFASLSGENAIAVIDPATHKVIRNVAVGTVPIQLYTKILEGLASPTVAPLALDRYACAQPSLAGAGVHERQTQWSSAGALGKARARSMVAAMALTMISAMPTQPVSGI